jgi:hypothetical protein
MTEQPNAHLAPPGAADPIPDALEDIVGLQYISPSYWFEKALTTVFDWNPYELAAQQVAGDWEAVRKAGDAVKNLADFNIAHADAVKAASADVAHSWRGNAADAATSYFAGLADGLDAQSSGLSAIAGQLDQMALGMYETQQAIKGLLSTLTDQLIVFGVELAATAALSATVVGGVAVGAAAAFQVTRILATWDSVVTCWTAAWNVAQAAIGLISGYLAGINGVDVRPLPGASYDHPGA